MDREERALWEQLGEAEEAMGFLLALLAGTGLSFAAAGVQRDALAAALRGEQGDAGAAIPLRGAANSLVVGALGAPGFGLLLLAQWVL